MSVRQVYQLSDEYTQDKHKVLTPLMTEGVSHADDLVLDAMLVFVLEFVVIGVPEDTCPLASSSDGVSVELVTPEPSGSGRLSGRQLALSMAQGSES